MGYRIHYGENVIKEYIPESKNRSNIKLLWVLIVCCAFIFAFSRNKDTIINYLLPGNKEVTRAAISTFADDLRHGESLSDAAVAFCREIIENANIQD